MAVSDADLKLLWGRAAGTCSNPNCRANLTALAKDGRAYVVGEMAHVIARQPRGPRGDGRGGDDSYENLILLCPTCHTRADKNPDDHPVELLKSWKEDWEHQVSAFGSERQFADQAEMRTFVSGLLVENHEAWRTLGPRSDVAVFDPGSNAHLLWELRKSDLIIPNNRRIMNALDANRGLLNVDQQRAYAAFRNHAEGFEANQFGRLDFYPLFPEAFEKEFAR